MDGQRPIFGLANALVGSFSKRTMGSFKLKCLFLAVILSSTSGSNGAEYPLQYQIETCLVKKLSGDYREKEGQVLATRYFPAQLAHPVTTTVLAEVLLTHLYTGKKFVLCVGGGISPSELAEGLKTVIDKNIDSEFRARLKNLTLVYYSHYAIVNPLNELTDRYGIELASSSLDSRSEASLIGSGC